MAHTEYRVLLTTRHHARESMGSYVVEGILETILAGGEDGRWLRDHVEFMAVPFMDKDGLRTATREESQAA